MDISKITKKERKRLIGKISHASGVAQYALLEKMTDEQVLEASQYLEVFKLIKVSNDFNRYRQGQKTQEANEKLKEFMNLQNSEILNAGKWLIHALSKKGSDRKQTLIEKDLVHKEDYNETVIDMGSTINELDQSNSDITLEAQQIIKHLEHRIDTLKTQQSQVKDYIYNNYSAADWRNIENTFNLET